MAEQVEKSFAKMDLKDRGRSTVALHADDIMNNVTDVSPPIHLSTTFRYTENPDELVPESEAHVGTSKLSAAFSIMILNNIAGRA